MLNARPFRPLLPLLALLLLAPLGCAKKEAAEKTGLRLPLVARPALDREQEMTRTRLGTLHDRAERIGADPAKSAAEKAAAYGELGQHYAALRQYEAAAACFDNAAQADPRERRWPYLRAVSLQEMNRPAEAAAVYEEVLRLAPRDPQATLHLAEVRYEERKVAEAEPLFEEASRLAPGCAAALWGLGKIASERGQWSKAVDLLEKAAAADPGADAIRYSLGQAWRGLGDLAKAQEWLAQSGSKRPRCADPLIDQISLLIHNTTLEVLRSRVAASDFSPRSDIGYAIFNLGTVVGGAEQMAILAGSDAGLRQSPRSEARWRLLTGALFAHRGLDDRAEPELRRAAELDPELGEARLRLGNLFARRGDMAGALAHYDAAARLLPGDGELALRRGKVLMALGRFAPAIDQLATAFNGGDGIVDAGLELAAVEGHVGRLEDAARTYAQVAAKAPQEKRAREGEATALILLGRLPAAKASLERAVADLPAATSLQHALARLLAAGPDGQRDPARAYPLAQSALAAEPTIDRVETLAMAAAALGRFDEAAELESRLVADARNSGRGDLAARLESRLALYRAGKSFRAAGAPDLIVSPPLLTRAGAEKSEP